METLIQNLTNTFQEATIKAFPELTTLEVEITPATQDKFGHYQCNSAMKLTKTLKKPPREIAQGIIDQLADGQIEKTEIAGPGFINITLKPTLLETKVNAILHSDRLGVPKPEKQQKVVIDFSSPNIAKEMHVGHLRSTIIGDSLARLFEFLGHDVLRLNHIGDWGTAFGMLIAHMRDTHPAVLEGKEETDLSHLVKWYKESKKRFDDDAEFKKRSQQEVVALQAGDATSLKGWKIICEISEKAYSEIYDLLDIKITDRGESFYNPMLPTIIDDLEKQKMVTISDGAKCVFLEGFQNREGESLPLIVEKSDGGYNYATTDLAAIRHRSEEEKADRIIYVTDAGQITHFKMFFQAAEKAGYYNPGKTRIDHVPFGVVLGADGKKFRTRSGETEKLIDLITNAIDKAKEIVNERNPDMSEEERQQLAHVLGIGAIKYADLSCHRTGDYTFSYDRMLRFEGNTAVFLLYSYVRVAGIKRKINADVDSLIKESKIALAHPSEIALGLHLARFNEILELMANELLPNKMSDYLYTLAEKFNAFFRDCRVEGTAEQDSRLLLCEATARIMERGLAILGVRTVSRM